MNNFRSPVVLFISSFITIFIGLILKIMHWPGAQLIIGSMLMVQAIAIIWLVIIVVKNRNS